MTTEKARELAQQIEFAWVPRKEIGKPKILFDAAEPRTLNSFFTYLFADDSVRTVFSH